MEIGSFVSVGLIPMTNDEMDFCVEAVKKFEGKYGFEQCVSSMDDDALSLYGTRRFAWKFDLCKNATYRDSDCNAYIPKYVRISVWKNNGYDADKSPKSYLHSFSCQIDLIGHFRRYRSKRTHTYTRILSQYTFGTELCDLCIEDGLSLVREYIFDSSHSKSELSVG